MTEPTPDPAADPTADQVDDETVDPELDTTGGTRDQLSTDDGLAEIAGQMPEVGEQDVEVLSEDAQDPAERARLDEPELDVDADGKDPLAPMAACDGED